MSEKKKLWKELDKRNLIPSNTAYDDITTKEIKAILDDQTIPSEAENTPGPKLNLIKGETLCDTCGNKGCRITMEMMGSKSCSCVKYIPE